jgi:Rieske Fe-S protein
MARLVRNPTASTPTMVSRGRDCPCHDSHYTHDGQVLHGPAVKNLPPSGVAVYRLNMLALL